MEIEVAAIRQCLEDETEAHGSTKTRLNEVESELDIWKSNCSKWMTEIGLLMDDGKL